MQVWFLGGLANSIKGDAEATRSDLTRARELFLLHECEEPGILEDIDRMLAELPVPPQEAAEEQEPSKQ